MLTLIIDNTLLIALSALAVVLLLGMFFLIKVALKHGLPLHELTKGVAVAPKIAINSLKQSFRHAIDLIENNLAERSERYNLAWTLVINGGGFTSLPLAASGLQSALSVDAAKAVSADGINWNFFDKGVAVQLQSRQLGDPQSKDSHNIWDELLSLCRTYRPDRPFDAIVFSLPAALLLESNAENKATLVEMAKTLNKRIWLAQNRFALQFPVYIIVDGCDSIPGFARFASTLPAPMRRSMLGWSSPFELSAPFQDRWIDQGMDEITNTLSDACMELSAIELSGKDSSEYFLLPTEINKLRTGLHLFMDELMRPSAYHDPFMFRGFYLTGDCSDSAQLLQGSHAMSPTLANESQYQIRDAIEPAFLRDLFEKKIFIESGLVRASRTQKLRHPAVHVVAKWGTVGFFSFWLVTLGLATLKINYVVGELVGVLDQFNQETTNALRRSKDEMIDPELSKERALKVLRMLDSLNTGALWAVPMPGSLLSIDDLNSRVQKRIEEGFAKMAFDPIRISLNWADADMTGAAIDPSNGGLVSSSSCSLPKSWTEKVTSAGPRPVDPDEQIEFMLLEQYVRRSEELQRAISSLMRLKDKSYTASGEDLRLVVKVLMGVELNGNTNQIAKIFRNSVPSGGVIDLESLHQATACAFGQMFEAFADGALQKNSLLAVEGRYSELLAQVSVESTSAFDGTLGVQAWNELLDQLKSQSTLLQPGKGAWIQRRAPQFGGNFEKLMQTVKGNQLLGSSIVDSSQKRLNASFVKFLAEWDSVNHDNAGSLVGKLEWNEKENRWAFNADRQALLENLSKLLSLPYVKNNFPRKLSDVGSNSTVSWDRQRLDQALSYAEIKRSLEGDLLQKFPAPLRAQATRFVHGALASKVLESTAQAMSITTRPIAQNALQETDQVRLAKLVSLLTELGANDAVVTLRGIISRDLLARLKTLDDSFTQANLFVPRDPEFKSWNGRGSPILGAFDAADANGLAAYVAQQVAYIENASKDAEPLLQNLSNLQANHALVIRWTNISAEVARNKLKSPISSLGTLTQFILNASGDFDLVNCSDRLLKISTARRNFDYFSDRLQSLQISLINRCLSLKENERKEMWMQFANMFNGDLANRMPFKPHLPFTLGLTSGNYSKIESLSADVDEVATLLTNFDRSYKILNEPSPSGAGNRSVAYAPQSVKKFEEQFLKVRQLLAPLYPVDQGATAGYDLNIEFRTNQSEEKEGAKIIDWTFTSGNQSLRLRDGAIKPLFWEPGMPISLSLRVAKDSPLKPKSDSRQTNMTVDDRTISYRFSDVWSLFGFIAVHREPERNSKLDSRVQLLRFEFPMSTQSDESKLSAVETQAKVFIKIGLSPVGKKSLLIWPTTFPNKAPDWTTP